MRTIFMNLKICKFFCAIFSKLMCFISKRKKSQDESSLVQQPLSTIQIQGAGVCMVLLKLKLKLNIWFTTMLAILKKYI